MKKPMTTAERKREWRKRLTRLGLVEYGVVIPDNAESREIMRKQAEHLSKNYVRKHPTWLEISKCQIQLSHISEPVQLLALGMIRIAWNANMKL